MEIEAVNSDRLDQTQARSDTPIFKICVFSYPDEVLTPLLYAYADVGQDPSHRTTLGFLWFIKHIQVDDTFTKLVLLDLSTQPHFSSIRPSYFHGSFGAVFAFSKSNRSSIESIKELHPKFMQIASRFDVSKAFIGFQSDSAVVTPTEGQELAQELGGAYYEMVPNDLQTFDAIVRSFARKGMEKYLDG